MSGTLTRPRMAMRSWTRPLRVPDATSATVPADDGEHRPAAVAGPGGPAKRNGNGRANGATRVSPTARRRVKRTVQVIVAAFAINYLVLPQLARLGDAIHQLTSIRSSFLVLGLALQLASIVAYSQLTREALPPGSISLPLMVRIQFATRALANIVPGGNAAAATLGYRLLTLSGVRGSDAGFALADGRPRLGRAAEHHPVGRPAHLHPAAGLQPALRHRRGDRRVPHRRVLRHRAVARARPRAGRQGRAGRRPQAAAEPRPRRAGGRAPRRPHQGPLRRQGAAAPGHHLGPRSAGC